MISRLEVRARVKCPECGARRKEFCKKRPLQTGERKLRHSNHAARVGAYLELMKA